MHAWPMVMVNDLGQMVPRSLAVTHNNIRYIHSVIVMLVEYTSSSLVTLSDREKVHV